MQAWRVFFCSKMDTNLEKLKTVAANITEEISSAKLTTASDREAFRIRFLGQKQRWFLLRLVADDSSVRLSHTQTPEFDGWRWVSYWYPVGQVVPFKREVYRRALKELAPALQVRA